MRSLFWLVGIAGCSETGVKQIKTGTLEVDPPSISIEGSCSYEEHVVTKILVALAASEDGENMLEPGWTGARHNTLAGGIQGFNAAR